MSEVAQENVQETQQIQDLEADQQPADTEAAQAPEIQQPPQKTQQQIEEELRKQEQQIRQREEQAKQRAEEERIKTEEDTKKLEEALKGSLSKLGKSSDQSSMMFTTLSLAEKQLERLFEFIHEYKYVRYVDISSNNISDISLLKQFKDLITLNCSKNQLSSLQIFNDKDSFGHLQILNISGNKIKVLQDLYVSNLIRLNLSENQIDQIHWKGHPNIKYLELRKNKLRKCQGLANIPNLLQLYLSQNQITDLRGLENLPNLERLYLRKNKIKRILKPFPFLPHLIHLNLRENLIEKPEEINKIDKHISSINLKDNPVTDQLGQNMKKDFSCIYPHIETINKEMITPEQRKQFEKQFKQKLAQQERQRLQKLAEEQEQRRQEEEAQRLEEQQRKRQQEQETLERQEQQRQQKLQQLAESAGQNQQQQQQQENNI